MTAMTSPFLPEHKAINLYQSLINVMTPRGLVASNDELYSGGVFGRDSLRVALDLLPWHPEISELVLVSLGSMIALKADKTTESRGHGHVPHEARFSHFGNELVGPASLKILKHLSKQWGGSKDEMIYYGAADTTPQYARLFFRHIAMYGDALLKEKICHKSGKHFLLKDVLLATIRHTASQIEKSEIGLLEFSRTNPLGHKWKVMRDGSLAYLHEDGELANANDAMAAIEVQGLAYDCLVWGSKYFATELPKESEAWSILAENLQRQTLERFWMKEHHYFAQALDRDPENHSNIRQITTRTSAPAELLETTIFDSLSLQQRKKYLTGILTTIFSPQFLTDVGIRMRSVDHAGLLPIYDYHGSNAVWGVTANVISQGLYYQGFLKLAEDIQCRVANGILITGDTVEFWYVDPDGAVHYLVRKALENEGKGTRHILGTNKAESEQAWTTSGELRRLLLRADPVDSQHRPISWQTELDEVISNAIPRAPKLSLKQAEDFRRTLDVSSIDVSTAERIEREYVRRFGYLV